MKIIFQILLFSFGLFLNQTAFAAAHFEYFPAKELKNLTLKENSKSAKKSWRKPNYRIKKEKGKHGFGGIISVISGITALFVVLKLTNLINWSWLWVISPIWITLVLVVLIIIYVLISFLLIPNPPKIEEIPLEEN